METKDYVGKFVKVGKNYGMIDNVYGTRLGFIWSDKDSWTGELIDADKVRIVSPTTVDGAKAFRSALTYFNSEAKSLRWRIEKRLPIDDPVRLKTLLSHCETWLRKLDA